MAKIAESHIALSDLWGFRAEGKPLMPDQLTHLYTCNDCLALLGICEMCDTIEQVSRVRSGMPRRSGNSK